MKVCADCPDPPGGHMCCEDGLTPFCIIRDGEAHGICRNLSRRASESSDQLVLEVIDIIVEYVGEDYRYDASQNITVFDGNVSYESSDGRVQVRATQVPLERGSPGELMPMR